MTKENRIFERDKKEVIDLTQKMVRIPSVYRPDTPGGNEEKVATFVYNYLRELGIEAYIEEVVPGRPNVIGVIDSKKPGKTLLFEGHTDVVTPGDPKKWKYDPFEARIVDGYMYGRGTNDTKGNTAAAITAVHSILRDKESFKGKMILCIPCDEEDMMLGIKAFIKNGWTKDVDGAIICEPQENQVNCTQKGAMRIIVRVFGKMAHGAMPLSGVNPNTRLAKVITEIEKLEDSEKKRVGEHEFLGWPSITPTVVESHVGADSQINVIPEESMVALDIRTVPGQDHTQLVKDIQKIIDNLGKEDSNFQATCKVIDDRPWTKTDRNDPVVQSVASAYTEVTGEEPVYHGVPGATDGTFIHMEGIPIITTGAGDKDIPHQVNEYVDLEELAVTTQIYRSAALTFLNEENN